MPIALDEELRRLFAAPNLCYVGTVRKDGTALVMPVWCDMEGDRILLNSAEGRAWPNNLLRDPRITLTVTNPDNPFEYVSVTGRVVERTTERGDADIDRLAKKYMGVDVYPGHTPKETRVTFLIEPERVFHKH